MRRFFAVFSVCAAVGFAGARTLSGPARGPATAAGTPRTSGASAGASVRCVDLSAPAEDDDCPDDRAALADCTRELEELLATHPTTRIPTPAEIPEDQQAGPWTDALADALVTCGIPATLEVADCEEYPCAAALRVAPEDAARAKQTWSACPGLAGLDLAPASVHCPDGTTEQAWTALTTEDDDWARAFSGVALPPGADVDVVRMLAYGRRVESVLQLWGCNVRAP